MPTQTTTFYPSTHLALQGGGWTNPTRVYAENGSLASGAADSTGSVITESEFGNFGMDAIPLGASIQSIHIQVKWRSDTAANAELFYEWLPGGFSQGAAVRALPATPNTFDAFTILLGNLPRSYLLDASHKLRVGFRTTAAGGPYTAEIDYVRIRVNYSTENLGSSSSPGGSFMGQKDRLRKMGARFGFIRDPLSIGGVVTEQPYEDLGTISAVAWTSNQGVETIYDTFGSRNVPITQVANVLEETWELTTPNVSLALLAMMHQSIPPQSFTQAATAKTDVMHKFYPNKALRIVSRNGDDVIDGYPFGIASIQAVKIGATAGTAVAAVKGVDYDYTTEDLELGRIWILSTSTLVTTDNTNGYVSYTPRAISGNVLITPNSGPCTIEGYGEIFKGKSCDNKILIDQGRYAITFGGADTPSDQRTKLHPRVTRLKDPTGLYPEGRIVEF